ncbi:catechol O-methyltransferase A isoform X2 [Carcharodon carcharias]|uniref:catechol O-methyltransferase A isoform X2 n=1 Tax=Carcharodon carcharias TaxID=13397 RepID=UPI001B7E4D93|nr:catechol O-methyltransferase A isoform X2 [Carcharodon carcharias]
MIFLLLGAASVVSLVAFKLIPSLVKRNGWLCLLWHDRIHIYLRDRLTGSSQPERVLACVLETATRGDPQSVLDAVDRFCNTVEWAMNVGDEKGLILDRIVSEVDPGLVLELGTYCGYSTVRIARLLKPGARLYTVEFNPDFAKLARQIISYAGVEDQVELLVGSSWDLIPELRKKFDIEKLDFVFLDHWKESYTHDTKLLESYELLRPGTVLLADNVTCPGAPEYLQYIRRNPRYRSEYLPSHLEYTQAPDGLEKSVFLG